MKCQICGRRAPNINISEDNLIVRAVTLLEAMRKLGWLVNGNLAYCPGHHPEPPEDMLEQLAAARGDVLATSRR